jgi:hypothetical protein
LRTRSPNWRLAGRTGSVAGAVILSAGCAGENWGLLTADRLSERQQRRPLYIMAGRPAFARVIVGISLREMRWTVLADRRRAGGDRIAARGASSLRFRRSASRRRNCRTGNALQWPARRRGG